MNTTHVGYHRIYSITALVCALVVLLKPPAVCQVYQVLCNGDSDIYGDTLSFASAIQDKIADLRQQDYLLANLDSTVSKGDTTIAYLYQGSTYQYGNINVNEADRSLINAIGLSRYKWGDRQVSAESIETYMEEVLEYLENHGYPFAKVGLTRVTLDEGNVDGDLTVSRGPLVTFDSIVVTGTLDVRPAYLRQYLLVKKGAPYSRKTYQAVAKRLAELPFMQLKSTPRLRFYENKASLHLELDKANSSRFDFLIGVLPSVSNGQRQFTITGEFTAELYNRLGQGEYIYASFERLRPEVQELEVRLRYPYLGGLPLGAAGALQIYRRASDFLEVESELGLDYQLNGSSHLVAGWNLKSSRLIDIDTSAVLSSGQLPVNLDVVYQGGKLGLDVTNLDYRWNPSKGYQVNISGKIGQKTILKNNSITSLQNENISFETSYDSLQLKTVQLTGLLDASYYLPLARIITLRTRGRVGILYNPQQILQNEYYRIGGNRLLRGFDEQSVVAESYALLTSELRLLLGRTSYLTLPFIDVGYTRVIQDGNLVWEQVLGVGLGINFATPAGIFNVSFASGRGLGNNINFNDTKVHFGYVSLF